jgi:hypothetical protein
MLLPHSSRSQIRIKIGSKSVKNAFEWALGLGVGSRIPLFCGAFESAWRVEYAENYRMLLPHSNRSQIGIEIGSKSVKNAFEGALGLGVGSRIPLFCGAFECAWRVERAENYRMLLPHSSRSQNGIEIGSKSVKNAFEGDLGLRVGSRIPVICGAFESAWLLECAENYRMLLPHSSRSQIEIKIGSTNVKNASELALGVRTSSRIPVICGAFESAWRVECA